MALVRYLLIAAMVFSASCSSPESPLFVERASHAIQGGLDVTAPSIEWRYPGVDALNVRSGMPVYIQFSEPMNPTSLLGALTVTASDGSPLQISSDVSSDGRMLIATSSQWPDPPARITASLSTAARDLAGNPVAAQSWSFSVPDWYALGSAANAVPASAMRPVLAMGVERTPWIAYRTASQLLVQRWWKDTWQQVGTPVASTREFDFILDDQDRPIVAWQEGAGTILSSFWNGFMWEAIGPGQPLMGQKPRLVRAQDGAVFLANIESSGEVRIRRREGATWTDVGMPVPIGGTPDPDSKLGLAAGSEATPWVSWTVDAQIRVARWNGNAWVIHPVSSGLGASGHPSLALDVTGAVLVAFQEFDGLSTNIRVRRVERDTGIVRDLDEMLDVELAAFASGAEVGVDSRGTPHVAWFEQFAATRRLYFAQWNGIEWQHVGSAFNLASPTAFAPAFVPSPDSDPVVAWNELRNGQPGDVFVRVAQFNGGTLPQFGIKAGGGTGSTCSLGIGTPPPLLSQTQCFVDLVTRAPVAGVIPYGIRSPLWSDGAEKRRFLVVPASGKLTPAAVGTWEVPIGTMAIKEFMIESVIGDPSTYRPIETRFLIRRTATLWEGYSYLWNEAGTEANLLPGIAETTKIWPQQGAEGQTTHVHSYPSRSQCNRCHRTNANFLLGIQTAQLNRRFDYGGVVDNQLRAMGHGGLLSTPIVSALSPRFVSPNDKSQPLPVRVRSYLHSNCSHCHRPGSGPQGMDFRFETPLASSGLCANGEVVPGSAPASKLMIRMSARPGMPPLATLKQDAHALSMMNAWITQMSSCP